VPNCFTWKQLKHPPIQKPSAAVRTFFDQAMNFRVNDLHREHYRQVSQRRRFRTGDLGAYAGWRAFDTHGNMPVRGFHLAEHHELLGVVPDQMLEATVRNDRPRLST